MEDTDLLFEFGNHGLVLFALFLDGAESAQFSDQFLFLEGDVMELAL